ncbi:MAG: glycosyltransferase family 2 protein [Bacteroidaceae bacterium]|nr:glycosyltransferase family 2 protein [Bacteroidaceae bacterium]
MVQVLMSTYNGMQYIREQLQSIYAQQGVDLSLLVRDDGSTDGTLQLLDEEQQAGRLSWYSGKNLGPAFSFWDLLHNAPEAPYYAFCDQDDVWDADKLAVAVAAMEGDGDKPALYFCQTRLVDERLNEIESVKISPLLTYGESLMYNFVTGCTMVLNSAMRRELLAYKPSFIRMHDIWIYNVAQAIGAAVHFDSVPHMSYRQHGGNAVGQINSVSFVWKNRWKRIKKNERIRSRLAQELLNGYGAKMSPRNRALTKLAAGYHKGVSPWMRLLFSRSLRCAPLSTNVTGRIAILLGIF